MKKLYDMIRDVPDFPKEGIIFKDITPLLLHPEGMPLAVEAMIRNYENAGVTKVVGIESRGFIFGAPIAMRLNAGFVVVRKPGKLPWKTRSETYDLEYGTDKVEIHEDAIAAGDRVLIVDDLLATGGTAEAATRMVAEMGGAVEGVSFLIELSFLKGRTKLSGYKVDSVLVY